MYTEPLHVPTAHPQGRRARRRRHGRADRRAPRQRQRRDDPVRPCREGRRQERHRHARRSPNLGKLSPAPLATRAVPPRSRRPTTTSTWSGSRTAIWSSRRSPSAWTGRSDLYEKIAPYVAPNAIFASQHFGPVDQCAGGGSATNLQPALLRHPLLQPAALHAPGRADPGPRDRSRECSTASKRS